MEERFAYKLVRWLASLPDEMRAEVANGERIIREHGVDAADEYARSKGWIVSPAPEGAKP